MFKKDLNFQPEVNFKIFKNKLRDSYFRYSQKLQKFSKKSSFKSPSHHFCTPPSACFPQPTVLFSLPENEKNPSSSKEWAFLLTVRNLETKKDRNGKNKLLYTERKKVSQTRREWKGISRIQLVWFNLFRYFSGQTVNLEIKIASIDS